MSIVTTPTQSAIDEEVFSSLQEQAERLNTAVEHIHLSRQAAATAIEAASQLLQQQMALGRQLQEYVSALPQPVGADNNVPVQFGALTDAIERQSHQLATLQNDLLNKPVGQLTEDPAYQRLLGLASATYAQQEQAGVSLESIRQLLQKEEPSVSSEQLSSLLHEALEPFTSGNEVQPTLERSQQLLQECQMILKDVTASIAQASHRTEKNILELSKGIRSSADQLLGQASQSWTTLERIAAQLSKPDLHQQTASKLDQLFDTLTRHIAAQQEAQKRQYVINLVTMLTTLGILLGLGIKFLRG